MGKKPLITDPLDHIYRNRIPCVFISPHLDDALLSCAGLISWLAPRVQITIVSVFTESQSRYTSLSIRRFLSLSRDESAGRLFARRKEEDRILNRAMGVKTIHVGLTDALFRTVPNPSVWRKAAGKILPEFMMVYPIMSLAIKSGRISRRDDSVLAELISRLGQMKLADKAVFAPVATGGHPDHLLVRRAVESIKNRIIYWSDFPYNTRSNKTDPDLPKNKFINLKWEAGLDKKVELINKLNTQINLLFPTREIPTVPEFYFFPAEI